MAAILGLKTKMANDRGIKKDFVYKKEEFERITTETDFVKKSHGLISIGLAKGREAILISEDDHNKIIRAWELFSRQSKKHKNAAMAPNANMANMAKIKEESLSEEARIQQILNDINAFSSHCLNNPDDLGLISTDDKIKELIDDYKSRGDTIDIGGNDIRAAIPLYAFIKKQCGVCRHHDLICGIVIADLVKKGLLPHGQVRQFRSNNHTVITYIQDGRIWVLDNNFSKPFYLVPTNQLSANPKRDTNEYRASEYKKFLERYVGPKVYNEMFERLLPNRKYQNAANAYAAQAAYAADDFMDRDIYLNKNNNFEDLIKKDNDKGNDKDVKNAIEVAFRQQSPSSPAAQQSPWSPAAHAAHLPPVAIQSPIMMTPTTPQSPLTPLSPRSPRSPLPIRPESDPHAENVDNQDQNAVLAALFAMLYNNNLNNLNNRAGADSPVTPVTPLTPISPRSPISPCSPISPRSPVSPRSPRGYVLPDLNELDGDNLDGEEGEMDGEIDGEVNDKAAAVARAIIDELGNINLKGKEKDDSDDEDYFHNRRRIK